MEFYFSDANITKNRNMREIIEKANASSEGFVDLNVFLEFTKMQRLTSNITHIQKALIRSGKLELSADSLKARRKIQFDPDKVKSDEAVEECTIYVENIPRDAEHEWLEKIFQAFGSVAYISLPKSKRGHHKGFAFVEFDDVDAARRCLEAYGEEGACLPNDIDPSELRSIQSFKEEQQEEEPSQSSTIPRNVSEGDGVNCSKAQKRTASQALVEDSEVKAKKERRDSLSSKSDEDVKVATVDSTSTSALKLNEDGKMSSSRKSKKKRKKNKSKKTIEARLESESIVLKVLPKKSWRQLRNRYLNLQRSNMTKLKKQLKREQMRAQHFKNFYQPPHVRQSIQNCPEAVVEKSHNQLDHIMEIILKKPLESTEQVKHKITVDLAEQDEDEAAVSGFIKFVDINDTIAYVRINSDVSFSSRADNLLQRAKEAFGPNSARFLSDKEVEEYKEKVQAELRQRLKEHPRKNIRGKDRLMKAATKSTHIKFESDSDAEDQADIKIKMQPT